MLPPRNRTLHELIADLEKELFQLSYALPETDGENRAAVLRKMWEVSGQIAEEKVRTVAEMPERVTPGLGRPEQ